MKMNMSLSLLVVLNFGSLVCQETDRLLPSPPLRTSDRTYIFSMQRTHPSKIAQKNGGALTMHFSRTSNGTLACIFSNGAGFSCMPKAPQKSQKTPMVDMSAIPSNTFSGYASYQNACMILKDELFTNQDKGIISRKKDKRCSPTLACQGSAQKKEV